MVHPYPSNEECHYIIEQPIDTIVYAGFVSELSSPSVSHINDVPDYVRDYATCIKEKYLANPPFPQPSWPPNLASEATKLFIVSRSRFDGCSKSEIESQPHDYAHDKVDNIKGYKKEIELAHILDDIPPEQQKDGNQEKSPKPPKVLMDGAPGIGKTTLTIKACKDWAAGRLFRKYYLMILVPLRQPKFREAKGVEDLCTNCQNAKVIHHISSTGGKNVAFIFDGYDELTYQQQQEESLYLDIIHGNLLPNCAVLVTSRPYASEFLITLHKSCINRHIELVGFQKEQIFDCVRKNINDQSEADKLIKQLDEREDIASLCYNPLNCVIVTYLYKEKETLFTTLNSLFRQFILEAIKRELVRKDSSILRRRKGIHDLDKLPEPYAQHLVALEAVAYKSLSKDKFIFNSVDLDSDSEFPDVTSNYFGLITSINNFTIDEEENQFQFFHLSIQEYLAARYASKAFQNEKQIDLIREYISKPRFRLFLLFYVGNTKLSSINCQILFRLVRKTIVVDKSAHHWSRKSESYNWNRNFFYLAHMIFETRYFELYADLFDCFCDKKLLSFEGQKLTLFDCTLLAHFLCSINHTWESVNFETDCLSLQSLNVFKKVKQERTSGMTTKVTFQRIKFTSDDPEMIHGLHLFPWLSDAKEFSFKCKTASKSLTNKTPDLKCLAHIPKVSISQGSQRKEIQCHVNISPQSIDIQQAVILSEGCAEHFKQVKKVNLRNIDCRTLQIFEATIHSWQVVTVNEVAGVDLWIAKFSPRLCLSGNLNILTLKNTGLTSYGAVSLFKSLESCTSLKELDVSCNELAKSSGQCEEVGYWLQTMLSNNKHIKTMKMCNAISDQLAQFLIEGLLNNSTLEDFDIDENSFTTDTILGIIDTALHHNHALNKLYIEGHVLQLENGKNWTLKNLKSGKYSQSCLKLLCVVPYVKHRSLKIDRSVSTSISIDEHQDSIRVLQSLECNKYVKKLKLNLSKSNVCGALVGVALEQMLLLNDTLENLSCTLTSLVCKSLASALTKKTHLKTLSLTVHPNCSQTGISCVMKALQQNRSIQKLKLKLPGDQSIPSRNKTFESDFQELLSSNSRITELSLLNVDDTIATGLAKELLTKNSLEKLELSFNSLKSFAVANVLLSLGSSKLNEIIIRKLCSLNRYKSSEWNLEIHDECIMGPQLQYVFKMQNTVHSEASQFKITSLKLQKYQQNFGTRVFKVARIITVLIHDTNVSSLNVLDLSNVSNVNLENGKVLGLAFESLMINVSLEKLILHSCDLPDDAWTYIGNGLRDNRSLTMLNACKSNITVAGVKSIFESLIHNQTLKELDLSKITCRIVEDDEISSELISAIEKALMANTSLEIINFKDSIGDPVTRILADALIKNTHVKQLSVSETYLTYHTLQSLFTLLDPSIARHVPFQLQFDEVLLSQTTDDLCLYLIDKLLKPHSRFINFCFIRDSTLYTLFCGICSIYDCHRNHHLLDNNTILEIPYVDSDCTNLIFRMLADKKSLVHIRKLTIHAHFTGSGCMIRAGNEFSHHLKSMLINNDTLHELYLYDIVDNDVVLCIAKGLEHNRALTNIGFSLLSNVTLEYQAVANLLHSISTSSSVIKLEISGMPLMTRVVNSVWCFQLNWRRSKNNLNNSLFPKFICILNEICNGNVSPKSCVAESLLTSLSAINLSASPDMDVQVSVKLLRVLTHNYACKELDLSKNVKLVNGGNETLSKALEQFLTKNRGLQNLNVSESLNNTTIDGLIKGLEHNETLKHLSIDANTLKIERIAKIIQLVDVKCLSSLTITDVLVLSHSTQHQLWNIKVLDDEFWSQFIFLLKETSPSCDILNTLEVKTKQRLFKSRFDSVCNTLQIIRRVPKSDKLTGSPTSELVLVQNIVLVRFQSLRDLRLNGIYITSDECRVLLKGITAIPEMRLQKLDVRDNCINESVLVELIDTLSKRNYLEELDISNNCSSARFGYFRCGPKTFKFGSAVRRLLRNKAVPLRVLNMSYCGISNAVCRRIDSGLQNNCRLVCLDVSNNDITSQGIISLLKSLIRNNCLQEMNLSGNEINRKVNKVLYQTLKNSKTLTTLKLEHYIIKNATMKRIAAGLAQTETLKIISIDIYSCLEFLNQLTLLPLLETKLVHINCSDNLTLIATSSGWTIEVISTNLISEVLRLVKPNLSSVTVSKSCDEALNFKDCDFNHCQMQKLLISLESNDKVVSLSLNIGKHLSEHTREFRNHLRLMLTQNSSMKCLKLYGVIDKQIAKGLQEDLLNNPSIEVLNVNALYLTDYSIKQLLLSVKSMKIRYITLYPIMKFTKTKNFQSNNWKYKLYDGHPHLFHTFFCNQPNVRGPPVISDISSCTVKFGKRPNDLSRSLQLDCRSANTCIIRLSTRDSNLTKALSQGLENMVKEDQTLQYLIFDDYIDDSVAMALTKGLLCNCTLQILELNISCLNDDTLNQLIQSLNDSHLAVVCRQTHKNNVTFVRCFSTSISFEMVELYRNKKYIYRAKQFRSTALGRILKCLTTNCSLQELAISSSRPHLRDKMVRIGVQVLLRSCTSLRTLKLFNPVSLSVVKGLAAGLKGNKTLCNLEMNKRMFTLKDVKPIFVSLNSCSLISLVFIDEIAFQRETQSRRWKVNLRYIYDIATIYSVLRALHRTCNITIDTAIVSEDQFKTITLEIPTVDIEITRLLLNSIGNGDFQVKCITFNSIVDGSDVGIGHDVQNMLKSTLLETMKVNLHCSTEMTSNLLVQSILRLDFSTSYLSSLKIGDLELERPDIYRYVYPDPHTVPWKITTLSKGKLNNIMGSFFIMLSQVCSTCCTTSSLCHLILTTIKQLRPSDLIVDKLITLFDVLQHNTYVIELDLSLCEIEASRSECCLALHQLLMRTTMLSKLDLSGIATAEIAVTIAMKLQHYKTLTSFSMDNPVIFGFDTLEKVLNSFADSSLSQLKFTSLCIIQKDYKFWFVDLCDSGSCLSLGGELLWSWCMLFILLTICKKEMILNLSLGTAVKNGLPLKVFRSFFESVKQCMQHSEESMPRQNAAMDIVHSVKELHLHLAFQGKILVESILKSFQSSTSLTSLTVSHEDKVSFLEEELIGRCFEKLLISNTSLREVNFLIELNEETVKRVATGIRESTKLHTLHVNLKSLNTSTFVHLLELFEASNLNSLNIIGCCVIEKSDDFNVNFTCDDLVRCKLFYASQNCCKRLREALVPGTKLHLNGPANDNFFLTVRTTFEESNVRELILSNYELVNIACLVGDLLRSSNSRLKILRLISCEMMSNTECETIAKALVINNTLKCLELSSNKIIACGDQSLLESLVDNCTLEEFIYSENYLSIDHEVTESYQRRDSILYNEASNYSLSNCIARLNTSLRILTLQIDQEEQLIQVFESLEDNQSLKTLSLAYSSVSTLSVASACSRMLFSNRSLQEFCLYNCGVSNEVCELIAEGLSQNKQLKDLDLGRNYINGSGLLSIFKTLGNNKSNLGKLNFTSNTICNENMVPEYGVPFNELRAILGTNTTLKVLEVSHLFTRNVGFGRELFKALQHNFTLTRLDIRKNYLDADTTDEFLKMLSVNTTITELVIRWCTFTPTNLERLAHVLSGKQSLKVICDPVTMCALQVCDDSLKSVETTSQDCYQFNYHYMYD